MAKTKMKSGGNKKASKKASKKARAPRASKADKKHHDEVVSAAKDVAKSKDHIAFGMNGQLVEFYYRMDGKTPVVMKAPADSPVDESGYRTLEAQTIVTGREQVRMMVKKLTHKTPSAIGISIGGHVPAKKGKKSGAKQGRTLKKGSAADLALGVLKKARKPLPIKELTARTIKAGWETKSNKPQNTLYGIMLWEITRKGKDSRFVRSGRGTFGANDK